MKKFFGCFLSALTCASFAWAMPQLPQPVCGSADSSCPVSKDLIYSCTDLEPAMVFDVTVGKNQKTQGTLHGESGLIANYDCEGGSTPSVLDCKMTDGSKSSKITVLHDLSQIKARIYDADHFTQINWPVNWDPLPGPKGYVESICETRHEIIQKTLKPMICKSADLKIQVQTSYTQGFSFFKIRGFTNSAGSSPNMDCVGQMFSPASYFLTGHQSSCPYSFAISNGNQLSLSCADQAPCSKKDLTCTPE